MTGVLHHIAVIEVAADADDDVVVAIVDDIRRLRESVPGVDQLAAGLSTVGGVRRIALTSAFSSQESLDAYLAHPDHRAVADRINEIAVAKAGADFLSA